jgi:replicative DNA helicase
MADVKELLRELKAEREKIERYIAELEGTLADVRVETLAEVQRRVERKPKVPKFATGVGFLDYRMNGGFQQGSFVQIAGQNFTGKTELVLTILSNVAKGGPALFFSFEMYEDLLVERLKRLDETQKRNLLIDQRHRNIEDIEAIVRDRAKKGVRFVAIDSRMKIEAAGRMEEYQKNSLISSRLSKLTQELGVVLLLVNQISEADQRGKRLALKGSGDQAYDADVILYLLANRDDDSNRVMVCDKDRVNHRRWKETYTLEDLRNGGNKTYTVYEYEFPTNLVGDET